MKKHIPNIITAFRLALVPVFIAVFFNCDIRWAFAVFLVASASDLLDGYLARKWQVVSEFGKLFDPLADKFMQITAVVCLTIKGMIPLIPVIIAFSKEALMLVGGLIITKKRGFAVYSNIVGKLASFFFSLVVCLCFFKDFWFATPAGSTLLDVLVWTAVVFSVIAMVQYAVINVFKPMAAKRSDPEQGAHAETDCSK